MVVTTFEVSKLPTLGLCSFYVFLWFLIICSIIAHQQYSDWIDDNSAIIDANCATSKIAHPTAAEVDFFGVSAIVMAVVTGLLCCVTPRVIVHRKGLLQKCFDYVAILLCLWILPMCAIVCHMYIFMSYVKLNSDCSSLLRASPYYNHDFNVTKDWLLAALVFAALLLCCCTCAFCTQCFAIKYFYDKSERQQSEIDGNGNIGEVTDATPLTQKEHAMHGSIQAGTVPIVSTGTRDSVPIVIDAYENSPFGHTMGARKEEMIQHLYQVPCEGACKFRNACASAVDHLSGLQKRLGREASSFRFVNIVVCNGNDHASDIDLTGLITKLQQLEQALDGDCATYLLGVGSNLSKFYDLEALGNVSGNVFFNQTPADKISDEFENIGVGLGLTEEGSEAGRKSAESEVGVSADRLAVLFTLDKSRRMKGKRWNCTANAVAHMLQQLRKDDVFGVQLFSDDIQVLNM